MAVTSAVSSCLFMLWIVDVQIAGPRAWRVFVLQFQLSQVSSKLACASRTSRWSVWLKLADFACLRGNAIQPTNSSDRLFKFPLRFPNAYFGAHFLVRLVSGSSPLGVDGVASSDVRLPWHVSPVRARSLFAKQFQWIDGEIRERYVDVKRFI